MQIEVAGPPSRSRRRPIGWDQGRWRPDAACSGMGTDTFFPVGEGTDEAIRQISCARAICGRCPVRLHCLVYSLVTTQEEGIWGGCTASERRDLRRWRRRPRRAVA